jgi:gliding motility-associated-like protein
MLLASVANATHIVGGSMSVIYNSGINYTIEMKVLRDCINGIAEFDNPATVGIFEKASHRQMDIFRMRNPVVKPLQIEGPNCAPIPNACTEMGVYSMNVQLSPLIYNHPGGYYLAYMRCCRNNIIVNIQDPGDASFTIYTEIPPVTIINSSPTFNSNPFTFLCTNREFTYNFDFTDKDGDSLVYSMVNPVNGPLTRINPITNNTPSGPYDDINWLPGFNEQLQVIGNPSLSINQNTGEVLVNALQPGVHVVAFKIEEFRFGIKIGEVRLELQLLILNCPGNPPPTITIRNINGTPIINNTAIINVPESMCIDIEVTDPEDSLTLTVKSPAFSDSSNGSAPTISTQGLVGHKKVSAQICWQTLCNFTANDRVVLNIEGVDNGCPFPSRTRRTFTLVANPMPLLNSVVMLCVYLRNDSIIIDYADSSVKSPLFDKYIVFRSRDNNPFNIFDSITSFGKGTFIDATAYNNREIDYQYYIRAQNICKMQGSPSTTVTSFENLEEVPQNQYIQTVTVEDNKYLYIQWPETWEKDFARYQLYKSTRDSLKWSLLHESFLPGNNSYTDYNVDVHNTSYCYFVMMRDTCQNISDTGLMACSIVLKGKSTPFTHYLNWQPYNYWRNGTKGYAVYRQDHLTPFNMISYINPRVKQSVFDHNLNTKSGIYHYYVEAEELFGNDNRTSGKNISQFTSKSNTVELIQAPLLHVPNAFSANRDGLNDVFNTRDVFVKEYHLRIYNRWGQLVFESFDKDHLWDGKDKDGSEMMADVYVYLITYTGWDDSVQQKHGNVTLLR